MPRWRKHSIFGDGPRVRLDRDHRARFRFLARAHRAANRLTADQAEVAEVLVGALGDDGRLDLAHATIAERALCHVATVKRALVRLRELGLVDWCGAWCVALARPGAASRAAMSTCCGRRRP
jgi:hypothetical protein